jgi:hypothetical protein
VQKCNIMFTCSNHTTMLRHVKVIINISFIFYLFLWSGSALLARPQHSLQVPHQSSVIYFPPHSRWISGFHYSRNMLQKLGKLLYFISNMVIFRPTVPSYKQAESSGLCYKWYTSHALSIGGSSFSLIHMTRTYQGGRAGPRATLGMAIKKENKFSRHKSNPCHLAHS